MEGRVIAVCLGPGGIPKNPVDSARLGLLGLEGDRQRFRFHGGPNRAVCLFSIEDYRDLQHDGVACEPPGAFGENLLIEGLDFRALRPDDVLAIGDEDAVTRVARRRDVDESRPVERTPRTSDAPGLATPGSAARDSRASAPAPAGSDDAAPSPDDAALLASLGSPTDVVLVAIHDVREPCKTLKSVDPRFPNLMLGRSGFVCRVIQGGVLRPGASVRRVDV